MNNDMEFKNATQSGTGQLNAAINNNYIIKDFKGEPTLFATNGKVVALYTHYEQSFSDFRILLSFAADIEQGRHEFHPDKFPRPPYFSYTEGEHTKGYQSDRSAGYFEVTAFDISKGTFKGSFKFTFTDFDTGREHDVVGDIDVAGLEHVKSEGSPWVTNLSDLM